MEIQRIDGNKQQLLNYSVSAVSAELQALLDEAVPCADVQFYLDIIQRRAGLTLELGCGTGRLLLPYLLAGMHVHGVEASPELYAICQARAQKAGVVPTIHRQQLDRLDAPMLFKTVYAPFGVLQRISSIATVEHVLQKLFEHLEMNGQLVIALEAPQPKKIMQLQGAWRMISMADRPHDRARIVLSQAERIDVIEQRSAVTQRYDVYHVAGGLETYLSEKTFRWYYKFEFKMMLERAGFSEIFVVGDYTMDPANDRHATWVFLATKRG